MNEQDELRTITQQIEDAHSRLLSINSEYSRYQNMITGIQGTINGLRDIKSDLEIAVKVLEEKRDFLNKEVEQSNVIHESTLAKAKSINAKLITITEEIDKRKSDLEDKERELSDKQNQLSDKEKELSDRELDLNKREEAHLIKVEKIRKAIE